MVEREEEDDELAPPVGKEIFCGLLAFVVTYATTRNTDYAFVLGAGAVFFCAVFEMVYNAFRRG